MFVNRIQFVVSVLGGVDFTTVEYVRQIIKTILDNSKGNIFKFYKNKGYNIKTFLMYR